MNTKYMNTKNIFTIYRYALVIMFLENPDLGDEIYYMKKSETKKNLKKQIAGLSNDEILDQIELWVDEGILPIFT